MADSIVRLRLESNEYDNKLRRASENLTRFGEQARRAGQSIGTADREAVDFVRAMGRMTTSATSARGKLGEMTKAFTDLSMQYRHLTDEEKNSPFGRAMAKSMEELRQRILDDKRALQEMNRELEVTSEVGQRATSSLGGFGGMFDGILGKLGMSTQMFTATGAAIAGVGLAFELVKDNIKTAMNFEQSVAGLSALTGKTGKALEELKNYAIDLGGTTTLSASEVAEAFMMIGSQQPQLLESGEALRDVTAAAIMLSEAAGIDLATAAQSLSTSINQFGGDSNNATRFVNVLAAASQKGAGDISFLGDAISKSGTLANAVGTSYEELVANLEQLAQAGIDASTSGTAMKTIIAQLEKQTNNDFKPSVVGLTQAFQNLNDAHLTTEQYIKLVGGGFFTQAMVLAQNADAAKTLTEEITGTSTAEEQARINTDTLEGSLKSLDSAWEAFNLHLNSTNGGLKGIADTLTEVIKSVDTALAKIQQFKEKYSTAYDFINGYLPINGVQMLWGQHKAWSNAGSRLGNWMFGGGESGGSEEQSSSGPTVLQEVTVTGHRRNKPTSPTTTPKKTGRGHGSTGKAHVQTPAEKAQQTVAQALASYAATIKQNDLAMENGVMDTLTAQKGEMSAMKQLMNAYGKAISIHDDPKYREAYTKVSEEYTRLGIVVKTTGDAQKNMAAATKAAAKAREEEAKKAAKEAEQWESYRSMSTKGVSDYVSMLKKKQDLATIGSSEYAAAGVQIADATTFKNIMAKAMQSGVDFAASSIDVSKMWEGILDGKNIPDELWQGLADVINAKLEEMGEDGIAIDFATGTVSSKKKEKKRSTMDKSKDLVNSINQISGGLDQMGIKVPESINKGIAVMQGLISVIEGVQAVIQLFSTGSQSLNTAAIAANTIAIGTLTTAMAINTATSMFGFGFFSMGGITRAAGGIFAGNRYSGDQVPVMVNSGELILNRAQQGNIASQLTANNTPVLEAEIGAESIRMILTNNGRRTGRGEYLTTKFH